LGQLHNSVIANGNSSETPSSLYNVDFSHPKEVYPLHNIVKEGMGGHFIPAWGEIDLLKLNSFKIGCFY